MPVILLRCIGACAGWSVTHTILQHTLLAETSGEAGIFRGMWFFFGGWMIVLASYCAGIGLGAFGLVPAINFLISLRK